MPHDSPNPSEAREKFRNRDDEMFHDHTLLPQIPSEVMVAALKVSRFFKLKGITKWKFLDLQSREFECERPTSTPPDAGKN